ncbi:hypothetical protein Tcan_04490 [Toxocara canis]|uniref:Uncharacterized protein n=1 Tax=Toxocara canis TaxID=6265 RepID=A0A0B2W0A0_TOXCA|nr:hypothetical protein Tcan_04490 [Toxocara canis]
MTACYGKKEDGIFWLGIVAFTRKISDAVVSLWEGLLIVVGDVTKTKVVLLAVKDNRQAHHVAFTNEKKEKR